MPCESCPGSIIEYDSTTGSSYCTSCGVVVEENTITSEVTFIEGGDGSSRMIGQFVAQDRTGLRSLTLRNRRINASQSREETIANAKRKIQEVAYALKGLNDYHIDRATQCYKMALMKEFTQGRKGSHVIAACLYIVCRQEKTVHMLIDFSDVLHINVYSLGNTFLKLIRVLDLKLPLIDPSLYLSRFAAQLELGEKTHQVTTDALRLVQRMKRDWIHLGRRPNGICGASLLIACRMHGFKRTQYDIIRVVKIGDMTLRSRLNEFMETPSAELSVDQFRVTDLTEECHPPSFKQQSRTHQIQVSTSSAIHHPYTADVDVSSSNATFSNVSGRKEPQADTTLRFERTWTDAVVDSNVSTWSDLENDEEIEAMLLGDEEVQIKTDVWEDLHKDWIEKQQLKLLRQQISTKDESKVELQEQNLSAKQPDEE
ncbi:hypothetical protein MIR68_011064 [Amoeboaphelidium protococcarum]|nr:hypothetical protein MIR68_011064 [Amoeboaphelidium protococcarum]